MAVVHFSPPPSGARPCLLRFRCLHQLLSMIDFLRECAGEACVSERLGGGLDCGARVVDGCSHTQASRNESTAHRTQNGQQVAVCSGAPTWLWLRAWLMILGLVWLLVWLPIFSRFN